ncbi:HNH endonuclease [Paenalkalicoccus suaedae]|uniref:HNH endonuclease n=2 Tax=Paenalkalicoccus suaedae TaxID=2592382 RepID=A0A859FKI0_9BACI|nr:HNH endonuclease [Paenalkalicoccus suaedae]
MFLTREQLTELEARTNCAYCGEEFNTTITGHKQIDHVMPLGEGITARGNLTAACSSCNAGKHNRHVLDYYARSDKFTDELLDALIADLAAQNQCTPKSMRGLLESSRELMSERRAAECT